MKKYEIWLADLDPSFGTEAGKIRPVVIVQTNLFSKYASTIICPITSNIKPNFSLTRVHLHSGDGNLAQNSDIMVDQIRAIDNKRVIKKIGELPSQYHLILDSNLKNILDL